MDAAAPIWLATLIALVLAGVVLMIRESPRENAVFALTVAVAVIGAAAGLWWAA